MGTVQHVHKQYKVYTDPKSGVEIHIWKDTKREGYDENTWGYGVSVGQKDDNYPTLKAAWDSMMRTVRDVHEQIKGKSSDELWEYSRQPYLHDIGKAIARAMARKIDARKQKTAKSIVIKAKLL